MEVSREDVLRCARLADLRLEEDEIEPLREAMVKLLSHAESLNRLSLEDIPPTTHGQELPMPRRHDEALAGFTQEEALANAPEKANGHFLVPKV